MDTNLIKKKFDKLGARAHIRPFLRDRWRQEPGPVVINVGHDRRGEYFDIEVEKNAGVEVLDLQPKNRHLLLMARQENPRAGLPDVKDKFLCGHDERHWFVACIPEKAAASTVVTAMEVLKPDLVRNREHAIGRKRRDRLRRKTRAFIRQGEWFFIPAPDAQIDERLVLHGEPIRRKNGKPHMCEFLLRNGGTTVYVHDRFPNGLTVAEYRALLRENPKAANWPWETMVRNPGVFVRGRITHPDHATVRLSSWHRVEMNTENQSRAMASLAFLD